MIPFEGSAPQSVTAEDIRVIVREELERMVEKING
jgi:hypothetical protein